MLADDFMRQAFAAVILVGLMSGVVGYVLVLRAEAFAGHALSHIGFTGAAGAVLIGAPPLAGLVGASVLAGIGMGLLGARAAERDVAIGVVLTASLGLGLLFLRFFTGSATQATALLFGNVLAVDPATVWALGGLAAVTLAALSAILRPLLFASLQPEVARARGVDPRGLGVGFLALVGLATAGAAEVVGVLLTFALLVGPAATALRLTPRLTAGIALSATLAVAEGVGGVALSWLTDWPVSFWIAALSAGVYAAAALTTRPWPT